MSATELDNQENSEEINENAGQMQESETDDERISNTNLIINYLPQSMNQDTFYDLFAPVGTIKSCRLMTDKCTGRSIGYGFVDFKNPPDAEYAINIMDGLKIENKTIKVSYARPSSEDIKFSNLYVSGLPKPMTQDEFDNLFSQYGKIITSRILYEIIPCSINESIKVSKGVGFIRFNHRHEAECAIKALNNSRINDFNTVLTVKYANNQQKQRDFNSAPNPYRRNYQDKSYRNSADGHNTIQTTSMVGYSLTKSALNVPVMGNGIQSYAWSIYVSNLPSDTEEHNLWKLFGPFGAVLNVNVIYDKETKKCKGIAFVTMVKYEEAILAIQSLNGKFIGNRKLQVSFKTIRGKNHT